MCVETSWRWRLKPLKQSSAEMAVPMTPRYEVRALEKPTSSACVPSTSCRPTLGAGAGSSPLRQAGSA